jgi:hypothetical protein
MSDWKPMPKPEGEEKDHPDEATHEVRKRDLPGNAMGPDHPTDKPKDASDTI